MDNKYKFIFTGDYHVDIASYINEHGYKRYLEEVKMRELEKLEKVLDEMSDNLEDTWIQDDPYLEKYELQQEIYYLPQTEEELFYEIEPFTCLTVRQKRMLYALGHNTYHDIRKEYINLNASFIISEIAELPYSEITNENNITTYYFK